MDSGVVNSFLANNSNFMQNRTERILDTFHTKVPMERAHSQYVTNIQLSQEQDSLRITMLVKWQHQNSGVSALCIVLICASHKCPRSLQIRGCQEKKWLSKRRNLLLIAKGFKKIKFSSIFLLKHSTALYILHA